MRKFKQSYLTLFAVALFLSSCGGLNKMVENATNVSYNVQPSPLEMHADEVEVSIKAQFPEKYFNKKAIVTVTPVLKYEAGQTEFEPIVLQGEKVEANNKVIPVAGGDYSYSGKIDYIKDMMSSDLLIEMSAQIGDKDPVEIPGVKIADGVIATPQLVQVDPKAVLVGDKFQRIVPETYAADIHYQIQKANVRNSELKAEDILNLMDQVKAAAENERVEFKNVEISAYASPDGPEDLNERLSVDRKKSADRYLSKQLIKSKIEGADEESLYSEKTTTEDWDGFKALVEQSSIQDKDLILRVLSMYSDPEVREKEIKNMAEAYEVLKDDILPELRRSELAVNIEKIGYSDDELKVLIDSIPDSLNLEEVLYTATLFENMNKKLEIYQVAAKNHPKCFRAQNNIGYVQLELGNIAGAKAAFETAKEIKDNDVIKNNLGAVALIEGDMATAENLFTSATSAGDVVNYNLGIIKIKQADYEGAVNYFGNKPSVNAALAQLLAGQTEKSITTLNDMGDSDDAMVYYVKAVASARGGKEDGVLNNLRTAIEKDGSLKEYAKKDVEFAKFAGSEAFAAILE